MHSESELSFDDCFFHADLIDIDVSCALETIRLITEPEFVPCMPDPRALTEVRFHNVSEFVIKRPDGYTPQPEDGPRVWGIDSASLTRAAGGIVARICNRCTPLIEITCERVECGLLPLDTRAKMRYVGSAFGKSRDCE